MEFLWTEAQFLTTECSGIHRCSLQTLGLYAEWHGAQAASCTGILQWLACNPGVSRTLRVLDIHIFQTTDETILALNKVLMVCGLSLEYCRLTIPWTTKCSIDFQHNPNLKDLALKYIGPTDLSAADEIQTNISSWVLPLVSSIHSSNVAIHIERFVDIVECCGALEASLNMMSVSKLRQVRVLLEERGGKNLVRWIGLFPVLVEQKRLFLCQEFRESWKSLFMADR